MSSSLKKIRINNWVFNIKDENILHPWFNKLKNIKQDTVIKKNAARTVFRCSGGNGRKLIVKYNQPEGISAQFASLIKNKACREYKSGEVLRKSGISCVNFSGWGYRGKESILISEEIENTVSVKNFWLANFADYKSYLQNEKKEYLAKLADFIRKINLEKIYHPDFHAGNIIYAPDKKRFYIVDPYGIKKISKLNYRIKFKMMLFAGAFRGELNNKEASDFLISCGWADNESEGNKVWEKIKSSCREKVKKLWIKRRRQILSGQKYTEKRNINNKNTLVRNYFTPGVGKYIEKKYDNSEKAKSIFLDSYLLDFHRIHHIKAVKLQSEKVSFIFPENYKLIDAESVKNSEIHKEIRKCLPERNLKSAKFAVLPDKRKLFII